MLSKDEARDMVNKDRHERGECKQPCHYCELEEIKAEKRLEAERISVNELSLANQELEERIRLLQEHADKLRELFVGQTAIRIGLEERVKELEEIIKQRSISLTVYEENI